MEFTDLQKQLDEKFEKKFVGDNYRYGMGYVLWQEVMTYLRSRDFEVVKEAIERMTGKERNEDKDLFATKGWNARIQKEQEIATKILNELKGGKI